MWRIGPLVGATLVLLVSSSYAAHHSRKNCEGSVSFYCELHNPNATNSELRATPKARSLRSDPTGRHVRSKGKANQAIPLQPNGLKSETKPLSAAARTGGRFSFQTESGVALGATPAPQAQKSGSEPWFKLVVMAVGGCAMLSLLLARTAEL